MPKGDENANVWMTFLRDLEPRVEEIEVDGKKIKRLVFEKHVNAEGITFPQTYENEEVVLEYYDKETGLKWVGKFPFKHALFKKGASFIGATFEGIVSFYGAIFEDDAYFDNTTFEGYVSFDLVVFNGVARFKGAKFNNVNDVFHPDDIDQQLRFWEEVSPEVRVGHEDPSKPKGRTVSANESCLNCFYQFSATFINAKFMNLVSFNNAEFQGAVRFGSSQFGMNIERDSHTASINFENAKFLGSSTKFAGCTFFARTLFINAKFKGYVNFEGSTFEQSSYFDRSEFLVDVESKDVGYFGFSPIDFRRTHFKKDVSFRGVEFYSKPNFSKAHFGGFVAFTRTIGANSRNCIFHRGVEFIECVFEKEADFQWSAFYKSPGNSGEGYSFKEYPLANFARSRFEGSAHFNFATFGNVVFNFVRFLGQVGFQGTRFNGHLHIREAVFENVVAFSAYSFVNVDIEGSRFHGVVVFSGAKLTGDFRIIHSTFEREVLFGKGGYKEENYSPITFSESAKSFVIEGATFEDSVNFRNIEFKISVKIIECSFNSHVHFDKSVFRNNCDLSGNFFKSIISFKDTIFEGDAVFDRCLLSGIWDFAGKQDRPYKFYKSLSFDGVSISGTVSFVSLRGREELEEFDINELESLFKEPLSKIEAARIQRVSFEKEGKRDEADRMFVLEMRVRRRARSERANMKIHNFLEWFIGDLPSEYGTNWRRIIWGSLLVVLYFGIAYWLEILSYSFYAEWDIGWFKWLDLGMFWTLFGVSYLVVLYSRGIFEDITTLEELISGIRHYWKYWVIVLSPAYLAWIVLSNLPLPFSARVLDKATIQLSSNAIVALNPENLGSVLGTLLNALYYSLVTFTTLGYGDMHPTGWLKALSAIEALTGAVFMALIVAVIARKWMR
ncbi:potassium channel family protein [Thermococcus aciditolerans]|uniref:Potassium channel family protein n=1 Tax=Thermococcus aciditolerans TaxID=2598455 RepID=A0A5C0SM30_9EURY|nr:potassium channel family protein [Thermococcus aciditolerans]QEK15475.1 potassium channel family protein [Thermococcus aciditolerans]